MRLTVGPHTVHVKAPESRSAGRPAALFLHGAGGAGAAFLLTARRLGERADGYLLDFPGHGASPGPAPDSIEGFADIAGLVAGALGIAPCVVVGHSMGAAVAVQLALSRPALVRGLGLVCAELPLRVHPSVRAALGGSAEHAAAVFSEVGLSPRASPRLRKAASAPIAATGLQVLRADLEACERFDPSPWLGSIFAPTVVVAGADDAITPVGGARALAARIPGARLVVVPGAGHMLPIEEPAALADALAALL